MRYVVNSDGGARGNPGIAGYGFVVRSEDGTVLAERAGYLGHATNNVAEYTAVAAALELIAAGDPDAEVEVRADSKLVVEQLSGRWKIKHPALQELALRARRALEPRRVRYTWVPRERNKDADALANAAMDTKKDVARGRIAAERSASDAADEDAVEVVTPDPAGDAAPAEVAWPAKLRRKPSGAAFYFGTETPVTIVFVRHGETSMTEANGFSGGSEPGPDLSVTGQDQAGRVARLLERLGELWPDVPAPSALWASPMVRTQQTAAVIADRLGVAVEVEEDLREVDFGAWQGLTSWEISDQFPGMLAEWYTSADLATPDGESPSQVEDRVGRVARRALAEHAGETVVFACHSAVTKVGVASLIGLPPEAWQIVRVPPASVSIVRLWPDAAELVVAGLPSEVVDQPDAPLTLF